jgi:hypothetical protein
VREIHLDLRRHCVETEIKKLYNLALAGYFKPGCDRPELEARIGLLKLALENFDFPGLRSRHSDLCGGSSQRVVLFEEPEGEPQLRVGDALVDAANKTGDRPKGVMR